MQKGIKYLFCALAVLLLAKPVPARQLPSLVRDSRVQEGTLACGVGYYLVRNEAAPGFVHIAVAAHTDTPVHHFPAVPVYKAPALDSALVKAFSLLAASEEPQAIVVSGDMDPVEIGKKLDILSILVPWRAAAQPDTLAGWEPCSRPFIRMRRSAGKGLSRVEVVYQAPPVPPEQRNTAQALVTDIFSRELVFIVRHRLEKELAGLPCLPPEVSCQGLAQGRLKETFRVAVSAPEAQLDAVTEKIAFVLSCLDTEGVSRVELEEARAAMTPALSLEASAPLSNRKWALRCIWNYRYGTHLAPFSEEFRLFGRKALEGDVYKDLLNSYTSALFDHAENLTLSLETSRDTLDHGAALNAYLLQYLQAGLDGSAGRDYSFHAADTLGLNVAHTKVRIKSERVEPLSGGTLWTFSNGLRVVFKRLKGSANLSYAWQLDGGLAQIPNLKEGEGGYIGPLLALHTVGGLSADAFSDMLQANGISLRTRVDLNGMALTGSAPPDRLSLLLKSLLALSRDRTADEEAFRNYLLRENLQGGDSYAPLYRKLHPGYVYGTWKGSLSEKTLKKADKFFDARLPHLSDGVLLLSGDLSEETVKKHLLQYVGALSAEHTTVPRRPVTLRTASGTATVSGPPAVLTDAAYAFTAEHFYTALIAVDALRDGLERRYGPEAAVSLRILHQPQERFRLLFTLEDVPAVRGILQAAAAEGISPEDLQARKEKLLARIQGYLDKPEGQVQALLERYSANKDVIGHYKEAIEAVTAEGVQDFLRRSAEGGRIESR